MLAATADWISPATSALSLHLRQECSALPSAQPGLPSGYGGDAGGSPPERPPSESPRRRARSAAGGFGRRARPAAGAAVPERAATPAVADPSGLLRGQAFMGLFLDDAVLVLRHLLAENRVHH